MESTSLATDVLLPLGLAVIMVSLGLTLTTADFTIVPLSIGMAYRARRPERAAILEPRLKRASLGAFVVIVAGAVASEWDQVADSFMDVAPAALALNVSAMSISFTVARLARLSDRQSTAIAMELGVHNSTLTIAVATTISTELAIPGAVYSLFMFITAGSFAWVMSRRNAPTSVPVAAPAT